VDYFTLTSKDTGREFSDIICTLELPKVPKEGPGRLGDWLHFIDAESTDELDAVAKADPCIGKAGGSMV
jgi:hypothetical protein